MTWTLFLDDIRFPADVRYNYGPYKNVVICRSMDDAVWCVEKYGLPTMISFDHDLADVHYDPELFQESFEYKEETGADCANFIVKFCLDNELIQFEQVTYN